MRRLGGGHVRVLLGFLLCSALVAGGCTVTSGAAFGGTAVKAQAAAPVILFGVRGGNMLPWKVTISSDGAVSSSRLHTFRNTLPNGSGTIAGLLKLAGAEGFASIPRSVACPGTNPDVGSRYISIRSSALTRTVSVHGGCVSGFNQLWDVLYASVGLP